MHQRRLEHALHNEAVCNYLYKNEDYTDWVITTAFYSALHFVQSKIFPITLKTSDSKSSFKVQTLEEYINNVSSKNDTDNKHKVLLRLTKERCYEIAPYYSQLKDLSWTARYSGYRYEKNIADLAIKRLQQIKEFCVDK